MPTNLQRAIEYMREANEAYQHAESTLEQIGLDKDAFLRYARQAGDALIHAKAFVKHGDWAKFVDDHFRGSHRTANDYMRIATEWKDERLVALREGSMAPTSVKGVIDVLRGKKPRKPKAKPKPDLKKQLRAEIRRTFGYYLATLDLTELEILHNATDKLFYKLRDDLRNMVCGFLDHDYYHDAETIFRRYIRGDIADSEAIDLLDEAEAELRETWAVMRPKTPEGEPVQRPFEDLVDKHEIDEARKKVEEHEKQVFDFGDEAKDDEQSEDDATEDEDEWSY